MSKRPTRPRATVAQTLTRIERRLKNLPAPGKSMVPHIAPSNPLEVVTLSDAIQLRAVGLERVKLTEAQELILNEPVKVDEVRMKPTGQPYLSHPSYTRWFNRAFGRFGWAISPCSKPLRTERDGATLMMMAYTLDVYDEVEKRMKSVAFAIGEQEMSWRNKEQTEGDAVEATVASAIRRLAKRMGVSLELWDKPWCAAYVREHCIAVKVLKSFKDGGQWKKKPVVMWRRKKDEPFPDELATHDRLEDPDVQYDDDEHEQAFEPAQRRAPSARPSGYNSKADQAITEAQCRRLHAIITNSRRDPDLVKEWITRKYGVASTSEITRRDYDVICKLVESREKLT